MALSPGGRQRFFFRRIEEYLMAWSDYPERYSKLPLWLQLILLPIFVPMVLLHGAVVVTFFLVAYLPVVLIRGWIENRRFWRWLHDRGRVGKWTDTESEIGSGLSTLIVEITPKGPGCSWLISKPREAIDPEHLMPTWAQLEERGWDVFEPLDPQDQWTVEKLALYESSATALAPTFRQLASLSLEAKKRSVIVVLSWCEGCLSHRNWSAFSSR